MPLTLTQTVAPTVEPLTLDELKTHARIDPDITNEDWHIQSLYIPAARRYVEQWTRRQLVTATFELSLDRFPFEIKLPRPPLQSVESITYVDSDGDPQTLDASKYRVDAVSELGRLIPAFGEVWPATQAVTNAVTVEFKAGYGDAAKDVPPTFHQMIALLVAHWINEREPVSSLTMKHVPLSVESLMSMEQVPVLA